MPKSSSRQKSAKRKARHSKDYLVFISHSSSDRWIAEVIAEKIGSIGASCWLDEKDLEGGEVIVDRIINGIDLCDEALVLISPQSVQSQWVAFEIGGVRAQHKRVTPILNNVRPDDMAPMKDIKGIDLNKFDRFLNQLEKRVNQKKIP
jgi:TIR domain